MNFYHSKLFKNKLLHRYVPEGNMTACGTDYLSNEWISKSYILVYSVFVYYIPLLTIIYCYYFIVSVRWFYNINKIWIYIR